MVFGVFDGLHEGHKYFLSEAKKHCDELIVVVTLPEAVKTLKKRYPKYSFEERTAALSAYNPQLKVVAGDSKLGSWEIINKYNPEVIFLGHDQRELDRELDKFKIPTVFIEALLPEKYKSSLLHQTNS